MKKLLILLATIQLCSTTQFSVSTNFTCNLGGSRKVQLGIWESDFAGVKDNKIGVDDLDFKAFGTSSVEGQTSKDHPSDEKEFFIYAWIYHNCTPSGESECLYNYLGSSNPSLEKVEYKFSANLSNSTLQKCSYYPNLLSRYS
ncbi:unnamed protein product [Caenorhabditis angaria]|uniref:Uncharacterized protein n=1 Tax=Caenorhabditis angaria TaxID=860376 RepID=A0A9P1IEC7_9PELO|nr:unnamed protein product [Caenorhabditis angaria]CAI5443594.1 unnamed protein product [Caenorhabditis angaria]